MEFNKYYTWYYLLKRIVTNDNTLQYLNIHAVDYDRAIIRYALIGGYINQIECYHDYTCLQYILRGLVNNRTVLKLQIERMLDDNDCHLISDIISNNKTIATLELTENRITDNVCILVSFII
jgi:hypothetical protein